MDKEQVDSNKAKEDGEKEELKRLTDFFSILIEIDRRENVMKTYDKPNK
jgi:hypothetical protein